MEKVQEIKITILLQQTFRPLQATIKELENAFK